MALYRGARLVEVCAGRLGPAVDILTEGERIVRIDAASPSQPPPGARVVSVEGLFVSPDLINTHERLATPPDRVFAESMMRKDLFGGVTAVRDMADDLRLVAELGRESRGAEIPGPDIVFAALMAGPAFKVLQASDIRRTQAEGKVGLIYGFQNLEVGPDLDRIDLFSDLGVRVAQLTYNPANRFGDGCMAPLNRGLTPLGRATVDRLNAARLMVDLSHSGERTCLDALSVSTRPISINHTGCRALADLPRNKTDAELRGVAEKGGFVGIYFMPYLTLSGQARAADVVAHIEHALRVCGEDHVGVGTDGDVTAIDDLEAYKARLAREIAGRAAAGIAATGEGANTYPFVLDLRGPEQFRKLAQLLLERGHSTRRIEKILGLNFLAFATEIWG
jgi:membrane dipeptidase